MAVRRREVGEVRRPHGDAGEALEGAAAPPGRNADARARALAAQQIPERAPPGEVRQIAEGIPGRQGAALAFSLESRMRDAIVSQFGTLAGVAVPCFFFVFVLFLATVLYMHKSPGIRNTAPTL